jgi:hypothetical protein
MPNIPETTIRQIAQERGVSFEDLKKSLLKKGATITTELPPVKAGVLLETFPTARIPKPPKGPTDVTTIPGSARHVTAQDRLLLQYEKESLIPKQQRIFEERKKEALLAQEFEQKLQQSGNLSKFGYSTGMWPLWEIFSKNQTGLKYSANHPVGATLSTLLSPFTAMSRGISSMTSLFVTPFKEDVDREVIRLKNLPPPELRNYLSNRVSTGTREQQIRELAEANLRTEQARKSMLGEQAGSTLVAGYLGSKGLPPGIATAAATGFALAEDIPYWLSLPPYTQLFAAGTRLVGKGLRPLAQVGVGLAKKFPLIDDIGRFLEMPVGEVANMGFRSIGRTQTTGLSGLTRNRLASRLDDVIINQKEEISREFQRALRREDWALADFITRELDGLGGIPEKKLASLALRTQTSIGMLDDKIVQQGARGLRVPPMFTTVPKTPTSLTAAEALLKRKQIDDLNRVIPMVRGKGKQALMRKRSRLENQLDNARVDILNQPYTPDPIPADPILRQGADDLAQANRQFNLTRGAPPSADPLTGFAHREITKSEMENIISRSKITLPRTEMNKFQNFINKAYKEFGSPYVIMPDDMWRPMKWAEERSSQMTQGMFREFKEAVGREAAEFMSMEGGRLSQSGVKLQRMAEYMRRKKLPRIIDDSLRLQFQLTDDEIRAFNFVQSKYKYFREMINRQYPGILPQELDELVYSTRLMPSWQFMEMTKSELTGLEGQLKVAKTLREREEIGKLVNQLRRMEERYNKTGIVEYRALPKSVKANFLEQRLLPEPLLEMNAIDNFFYYGRIASRKIFEEPVLKHISRSLPNVKDPAMRKYIAQVATNWGGFASADTAFVNMSKGLVQASNFFFLTSPHQFFMNASQIANTAVDVGPFWTTKAAMHVAARSDDFVAAWARSMYKNDVEGIIKGFAGKPAITPIMKIIHPIQLAEPGLRMNAYYAAYLKAQDQFTGKMNTRAAKFVKTVTDRGFKPEEAFAMWGDRALERNQFIYGKLGLGRIQQTTFGRPAFLYTSYTIKELELLKHWAKTNPEKLIVYGLLTLGGKEFARTLGVDMGNYIGLGIDERKLVQTFIDLNNPMPDKSEGALKDSLVQRLADSGAQIMEGGAGLFPGRLMAGTGFLTNLYRNQRLMPIGLDRLLSATAALNEGRQDFPVVEITDEDRRKMLEKGNMGKEFTKAGFPWRRIRSFNVALRPKTQTPEERAVKAPLEQIFTPRELMIRTMLGRPINMKQQRDEFLLDKRMRRTRAESLSMFKRSLLTGNKGTTRLWMTKYMAAGGRPQDLNRAIMEMAIAGQVPRSTRDWVLRTISEQNKEVRKFMRLP